MRLTDMFYDVLEAESQLAYENEGERLASVAFPVLKSYKPTVKPFYRKIGGLHFLSFGPFRVSFCKVKQHDQTNQTNQAH